MKNVKLLTTLSLLFAAPAFGKTTPTTLGRMTDEAISEIPAVLVEDVTTASDSRGEMSATATLITVYTGPIIAPFTTYIKIFDPIPQDGGDYGSFEMFKIPYMMNDLPKQLRVQIGKSERTIYVGFNANYFGDFNENGNAMYEKGRMIVKFSITDPVNEGKLGKTGEFSIRK